MDIVWEIFQELPGKVQGGLVIALVIFAIIIVWKLLPKAQGLKSDMGFSGHYGFKHTYGTAEWRRAGVREVLAEDLRKLTDLRLDLAQHNATARHAHGLEEAVQGLNQAQAKQVAVDAQSAHIKSGVRLALDHGYGNTSPIDNSNPIIDSGLRDVLSVELAEEFEEIKLMNQAAAGSGRRPAAAPMPTD